MKLCSLILSMTISVLISYRLLIAFTSKRYRKLRLSLNAIA